MTMALKRLDNAITEPTVVGGPDFQSHFLCGLAVERLDKIDLSSARADGEVFVSARDRVGDDVMISISGRNLSQ